MVELRRLVVPAAIALVACEAKGRPDAPAALADDPEIPAIARLHEAEERWRAKIDAASLAPSDDALGPDPYAIVRLPSGRFAGLLRGAGAIVLLDDRLHEIARKPAAPSPVGIAVAASGRIFVAAERSHTIDSFREHGAELEPAGSLDVGSGPIALRDLATGPHGLVYAIDEHAGRLLAVPENGKGAAISQAACAGPIEIARVENALVIDCLLDHTILVRRIDERGAPLPDTDVRIRHDGPIWSFDAKETRDGLVIAMGGIEDHPLDRTEGSFGFIDSFAFVVRIAPGEKRAERLLAVNVSELGVVTPKAVALDLAAPELVVSGYGADKVARIALSRDLRSVERVATLTASPGIDALVPTEKGFAFANPLLDAWGTLEGSVETLVPVVQTKPAAAEARLGEALVFTTLMAPWNKSEGRLSRFTCEACHYEGYGDGRTHATGRGDIHATTRPLAGLWSDRPYFSRALDPDLVSVAYNEFKVAGAKSEHDPWFSIAPADYPWLGRINSSASLSAEDLRRAFMTFFTAFPHRESPVVAGRTSLSVEERDGADAFAALCEGCHSARLVTDDPTSRLPRAAWEPALLHGGSIVWARPDLYKTGVEPYVNEEKGARVPSLRRLYKKTPYFTNGSAGSIGDVLARAKYVCEAGRLVRFSHDATRGTFAAIPESPASRWCERPANAESLDGRGRRGELDANDRAAITAFLDLL